MFQHASNPKIVDVIADLLGADDIKVYGDQLCARARPSLPSFLAHLQPRGRHAC